MRKTEIPVSGMHCASCVNNVEQYLKKLNGIVSVNVNLAAEKAFIEYDEGQIDIAGIVKAINDSGYQVPEMPPSSEAPALAAVSSLDTRREEYYRSLKKRFLFALIFAVPVFLGGMHMFFPFLPAWLHDPYIMLALAAPVQIFSGWPFYQGLWAAIKRRNADMNTLVAVGTTAAFGYSLAATFIPEFFARAGQSPVYYYDSAAV
ncbi:MAG: cation transporter, partial [Candidatus Edwardsbacteria bacterium]|nr:cation transporter [Candidatus Edwardsbacteria bacterium]MBU1576029.1 cation transporter [Candidatus Edwardsbacteria bacterium]MBU2463052.1 cation transporter [Candidatus Edwardsbacteria bacterium]